MSDDYLWDKSGEPDPEVVRLEKALAPLRHEGQWQEPKRPIRRGLVWGAFGALALAASVAIAVASLGNGDDPGQKQAGVTSAQPAVSPAPIAPVPSPCIASEEGFAFKAVAARGSPASPGWAPEPVLTCGGAPASSGRLPAGVWIETPDNVAASVQVADIGAVTLNGGSRLRIVETSPRKHRLELVRGSLHAKVVAPPRLFVIDTRAATAVDLGCAYDLSVDGAGRSHLHVTSGVVSLEGKGAVAYVPQRSSVTADPDRGPGAVLADSASKPLIAAIARLDQGDASALADVLKSAERTDSVTLWNLLNTAGAGPRAAIVQRIEELGLRPAKVARAALLAGKAEAFEALLDSFEDDWFKGP
jgi:hypothetical protein